MTKKLLLSQPEERNHKLQKLPSDKENNRALAFSTWGEKTTNCKSFLVTRRTTELLLSQPGEKKTQIAKASSQKGDGEGGLTGDLNLRRRTNHILLLLLLLHSLWRRRTHNQHTIQQMKKFNCKNFTRTL
jgi:hypothetical protein